MATTQKKTGCFKIRQTAPEPGNKFYHLKPNSGHGPANSNGYADYRWNELDDEHPAWVNGLNCLPDCCGYARGRFNEIYCQIHGLTASTSPKEGFYWTCHNKAGNFIMWNKTTNKWENQVYGLGSTAGYKLKISKEPAIGAIAVNDNGGDGHVAIVEQVFSDGTFMVSESGWSWGTTNYFRYHSSDKSDWNRGFILQPDSGIPMNEVVELVQEAVAKIPGLPSLNTDFSNISDFKTELNKTQNKTEINNLLKSHNITLDDINDVLDLMNSEEIDGRVRSYFTDTSEYITDSSSGYRYTNDPPEKIDYPSVYYAYGYGPLITLADEDEEKNEFAKFYPNIQLNFGTADNPEEITLTQITQRSKNWTEDTIIRFNLNQASNTIKQILAKTESISRVNSNSKGLIGEFQMPSDTIVGFTPTDLTYTGELVANVGDTITSVLDKIVEFLNNDYEYFYNTDGQFVFRKKLTGVHLDYDVDTEDKSVIAKNRTNYTPEIFPLEDSRLVISVNNNPDFANVKNDFSVWGTRDVNDTAIPIHYRCAIDKKPVYYKTLPRLVPRYFTLDTEKEIVETLVRRFSEIISEKESDFEAHLDKCLSAFNYQSQKVENAYLSLWGKYDEDGNFVPDERLTELISGHPEELNVQARNVDSHLEPQDPGSSTGLNYFMFLLNYLYYNSIGRPYKLPRRENDNTSVYENAYFVPKDVQAGEPLIFGVPLFKWEGDDPTLNTETNRYEMKYIDCPKLRFSDNEMRYSIEQRQALQSIEQARIDEIWARNAATLNRDLDAFKQDYEDIQNDLTVSSIDDTNLLIFYDCANLDELKALEWWPEPEPIDNLKLSNLAKRLVLKPRPSVGSSATEEQVLKDAKKYNFFVYGKKDEDDFDTNNESNLINGIMNYIQSENLDAKLAARRDRLLQNLGVKYEPNYYEAGTSGGQNTYVLDNSIISTLNKLKVKKGSKKTLSNFQARPSFSTISIEDSMQGFDFSVINEEIFHYLEGIWRPTLPLLDGGVSDVLNHYFDLIGENESIGKNGRKIIANLKNKDTIAVNNNNIEQLYKDLQELCSGYREEIGEAFDKIKKLAQEIRDYIISQLTTLFKDEVYKDIKAIKTAYAKEQYVHGDENAEDHKTSIVYVTDEKYLGQNETCPYYVVDWREIIWQMAEDYNKSNIDQIPNWLGDADFLWRVAKNNQDYYPTGKTGYEQYYIDVHDNFRDLYQEGYHWSYNDNTLTDELVYYWKREGSEDIKFNPVTDDESTRRLIDIPETLNFYFDFIDGNDSEVSQFSVPAIGRRPKFVNDEKVKVINNEEVPQILFVPEHEIMEDFSVGDSRRWSYKILHSDDLAFIDEDSAGDAVSGEILKEIVVDQIKLDYPDFRVVQVDDAWFVSTDIVETDDDESENKINGGFYPTGLNRSAKEVIESWLSQYTYCGENLNLTTLPIYNLKPNTEIYISDKDTCTSGLYLIKTVSIPLAYNGTMNISCTKQVRNIK